MTIAKHEPKEAHDDGAKYYEKIPSRGDIFFRFMARPPLCNQR